MRVVFTTWAWPSHLYALAPLAWACRTEGHEVLYASEPGLYQDILRTGLPAARIGSDVDTVGMVREYLLPTGQVPAGTGARPGGGPRAVRMLLAHAESMAADLLDLVRDWRADAVVYDPTAIVGALVARAAGIPAIRQLYGADLIVRAKDFIADAFAPLAARYGASGFDQLGAVTVDPVPASMQNVGEYCRLPIRYVPFNGPGPVETGLPARTGRPRICVSWGHTIAKVDPNRFLVGQIISAAADLDVELVLAISAEQRALLGPLPAHVRVLQDVPLQHVLPGCDLFVGHGGASSILTALSYGVPLLLVPQLPDHAGHSAQVVRRGAGQLLAIGQVSVDTLRTRIANLLDPAAPQRIAAQDVAAEMREQPTASSVVAELDALVRDSELARSAQ